MQKLDRQREHQANERTFLAWLRTAIALIGFGFAIARFGLFLQELRSAFTQQDVLPPSFLSSQSIGVVLVITGVAIIPLSVWQYNRVFWQIEHNDYKPNRLIVWVTAGVVVVLGLLSLPLILWRQPVSPHQNRATAFPAKVRVAPRLAARSIAILPARRDRFPFRSG